MSDDLLVRIDQLASVRDAEGLLRDCGLSRTQAKALVSRIAQFATAETAKRRQFDDLVARLRGHT